MEVGDEGWDVRELKVVLSTKELFRGGGKVERTIYFVIRSAHGDSFSNVLMVFVECGAVFISVKYSFASIIRQCIL